MVSHYYASSPEIGFVIEAFFKDLDSGIFWSDGWEMCRNRFAEEGFSEIYEAYRLHVFVVPATSQSRLCRFPRFVRLQWVSNQLFLVALFGVTQSRQ